MNWDYKRRKSCRICDNKNLEIVIKMAPTPHEEAYLPAEDKEKTDKRYPVDVCLCKNPDCGLLQLVDIINPELMYGHYIYQTVFSLGLDKHFESYAEAVMKKINPNRDNVVVDIGSNNGLLLYSFQNRGMRVLGIDPAQEIAKNATENGIETLPNFFNAKLADSVANKYGKAGIITANMVFANLDDVNNAVRGIKKLLSPEGVFIVETGYVRDMIQGNILDNITHEHLSYFGATSLRKLFKKNGLEMIDAEKVETKGGSIRCYAQLKGGKRKISDAVYEFADSEKSMGFTEPEVYNAFNFRVQTVKKDLLKKLDDIKSRGKTIAGFGAACPVTTMIYNFELENYLKFLVDDNPARYGKFCPGLNLQVFPPNKIKDEKIDYTVILPWRYSEIIMKKHQDYTKNGGRFITIPLNGMTVTSPPEN